MPSPNSSPRGCTVLGKAADDFCSRPSDALDDPDCTFAPVCAKSRTVTEHWALHPCMAEWQPELVTATDWRHHPSPHPRVLGENPSPFGKSSVPDFQVAVDTSLYWRKSQLYGEFTSRLNCSSPLTGTRELPSVITCWVRLRVEGDMAFLI